jgi:hypothetical protein
MLVPRFALLGIRVLIIGAVAVGGLLFRDRLTGGAGDLSVGDCFDEPATIGEVHDVQHHPCTESHDAEVVFVGDMPERATYPTDAEFVDFIRASCVPAFNAYTSLDFEVAAAVDMGYFTPTAQGWTGGDHEMICYAIRSDGARVSQSFKIAQ